jgi:hypothetical protein
MGFDVLSKTSLATLIYKNLPQVSSWSASCRFFSKFHDDCSTGCPSGGEALVQCVCTWHYLWRLLGGFAEERLKGCRKPLRNKWAPPCFPFLSICIISGYSEQFYFCLPAQCSFFVLLLCQCSSLVCLFLQTVQGVNGPAVCLVPSFLVFSASFNFLRCLFSVYRFVKIQFLRLLNERKKNHRTPHHGDPAIYRHHPSLQG